MYYYGWLVEESVMLQLVKLSNYYHCSHAVWFRNVEFSCFKAGKGGELTHDETTIISGALDLTEKVNSAFPTWYILNINISIFIWHNDSTI